MPLANLFQSPKTPSDLRVFSFANQDQHQKITNALYQQQKILLPVYALDPIPPSDLGTWLRLHQTLHAAMCTATNVASNDLTEVNLKNESELKAWVWLHYQEHLEVSNALGLRE